MSCFDPSTSILAGQDDAALRVQLAQAQQAYMALSTGGKGETFSYTQGDGAKSVTYTKADLGAISQLIRLLQAQLGIIERPRRAIHPSF